MSTALSKVRHVPPSPGARLRGDRFRQPSTYTYPPHETRRGFKAIFPARSTAPGGANAPSRVT